MCEDYQASLCAHTLSAGKTQIIASTFSRRVQAPHDSLITLHHSKASHKEYILCALESYHFAC